MSSRNFPFAVRLIGFPPQELEAFDAAFETEQANSYGYFRLAEGNLQDPDLYIANAGELKALVTLTDLRPSDVRPALLIGQPDVELPYRQLDRPLAWPELFAALDALMETRADALSRLEASDVVTVPERRRRDRLDLDLTDPAEYEKMRSKVRRDGAVLVVDKSAALRDYLADLLARQRIPVVWVNDEVDAVEVCKQEPISAVLINTSTPGVDPYRLCWAIKEKDSPVRIAVIFLISKPFVYDLEQASYVGADGFLNKPLASHHLITALKKFLPFAR
ncbi:MAG TPA: response regulator [Noviherbaspirillum sp.]|uniref:response regulator n=1 Tax=Noviherbaspirillum sp. TaxID=1926288 RepID=UPI002B460AD9|nr:response regulator [Noviherbaspirillum sp.]HJV86716.1 response regulator [Noviherbaspirillum sp.]